LNQNLPSTSNSAGRSPARLVFRTVHETFALIRLLAGAILVMVTSLRFEMVPSVDCIMAVPMQDRQVVPRFVGVATITVMHIKQTPRHEVKSTVSRAALLVLQEQSQAAANAGVMSLPTCPVRPIPVERTFPARHLDVTDDLGPFLLEQSRPLLGPKGPV